MAEQRYTMIDKDRGLSEDEFEALKLNYFKHDHTKRREDKFWSI